MQKTLVIGANGQIGRLLVSQLVALQLPVVALVKGAHYKPFPDAVEVVVGNLEDDVSNAMQSCDSVVFTAGSGAKTGADKTLLVDLWGACKAIDAAKACGVKHFVMVSARNADNPDHGNEKLKPYLVAKHFADQHLIATGLGYTILRPGRLTNEASTSLIRTSRPTEPKEQCISRADVASVITYCLNNRERVLNKTYELYQGSDAIADVII